MDKYYIEVNSITYCYPYEVDKKVTDYGVLNKYIGKEFSRKENLIECRNEKPYRDEKKKRNF